MLRGQPLLPAREPGQQRIGYLEQRFNSRAGARCCAVPAGGRSRQVRQPAKGQGEIQLVFFHKLKQFIGQRLVAIRQLSQPQLAGEALAVLPGELTGESIDRRLGQGHRLILVRMQYRQQGLGQGGQVPVGNGWLVAEGVASGVIDGAVDLVAVKGIHERAGAVIDSLSRQQHIVGIHHPVDKSQ